MAITLMIVDDSEDFRLALERVLSGSYQVVQCSNGVQALEAALQVKPEVMILDLMLTEMDGVTLLHELRKAGLRPMVLAVTRFFNDYVLESAQELGIGYIIRKPCSPSAVAQRVRDLSKRLNPGPSKPFNPAEYVNARLRELMFSPRHKGVELLKQAVLLMCEQPDISITKELYPRVGASSGSSAIQVERVIRSAIQAAWTQAGSKSWGQLFPCEPDGTVPRPSNGQLIARLSEELREKLAEAKEN